MKAHDQKDKRVRQKEFSYVLPLSSEDRALVCRYQELLAHGVARFADVYYNYLFDNPATAEVLYRYEAEGNDVSDLVRSHLQQLISLFGESSDEEFIPQFLHIGRQHARWDIEPIWIQGAFQTFLNHLQQIVCSSDEISDEDRKQLNAALVRTVFRASAITTEGYWGALLEHATGHDPRSDHARGVMELFEQMSWTIDVRQGRIEYISPAAEKMFGKSQDIPIPNHDLLPATEYHRVQAAWEQCLSGRASSVLCQLHTNGEAGPKVLLQFRPEQNGNDRRVTRASALAEDVSSLVFEQDQLKELSVIDPVTRLINRALWDDRIHQAVSVSNRLSQCACAVLLIDFPDYARIQKHAAIEKADRFLCEAADRTIDSIRTSDTVARVDEHCIGVLLAGVNDGRKAAEAVVEKIAAALQKTWSFDKKFVPGFHIGVAVHPASVEGAEDLHECASIALDHARQQRVSCMYYREDGEAPPATHRFRLAGPLYHALDERQFEVHYQPKVDMRTFEIKGAEALLRWQHPDEGLLLPGRFLEIAERANLMADINNWVMQTGARHRSEWLVDGKTLPVAINVSASTFRDNRFVNQVRDALQSAELQGDQLEIEIREEALLEAPEVSRRTVRQLSELGVKIIIDDYGSGCCSLSAIADLPIDSIKIDPCLLDNLFENERNAAKVKAIIEIGHTFGFKVCAEAVEDPAVWEALEKWGCDAAQGFHVTRPIPEQDFASQVTHGAWFPASPIPA